MGPFSKPTTAPCAMGLSRYRPSALGPPHQSLVPAPCSTRGFRPSPSPKASASLSSGSLHSFHPHPHFSSSLDQSPAQCPLGTPACLPCQPALREEPWSCKNWVHDNCKAGSTLEEDLREQGASYLTSLLPHCPSSPGPPQGTLCPGFSQR